MTSKWKWLVDQIFGPWLSYLSTTWGYSIHFLRHQTHAGCITCNFQYGSLLHYLLSILKWPSPEFLLRSHQILDIEFSLISPHNARNLTLRISENHSWNCISILHFSRKWNLLLKLEWALKDGILKMSICILNFGQFRFWSTNLCGFSGKTQYSQHLGLIWTTIGKNRSFQNGFVIGVMRQLIPAPPNILPAHLFIFWKA